MCSDKLSSILDIVLEWFHSLCCSKNNHVLLQNPGDLTRAQRSPFHSTLQNSISLSTWTVVWHLTNLDWVWVCQWPGKPAFSLSSPWNIWNTYSPLRGTHKNHSPYGTEHGLAVAGFHLILVPLLSTKQSNQNCEAGNSRTPVLYVKINFYELVSQVPGPSTSCESVSGSLWSASLVGSWPHICMRLPSSQSHYSLLC